MIPSWKPTHPAAEIKRLATEVAGQTSPKTLYIYWNPDFPPDPYFQYRYNNEIFTWYMSVNLRQIIKVESKQIPGAYYLARKEQLEDIDYRLIRELEPPLQVKVCLVEFETGTPHR
jgi:hypothetical protein